MAGPFTMSVSQFAEPCTLGPDRRPEGEEVAINRRSRHVGHSKFAKANLEHPWTIYDHFNWISNLLHLVLSPEGTSEYSRS